MVEVFYMKPCVYFKKKREKTSLSMRDFAKQTDVSLSVLISLSNGSQDFTHIPLVKAVRLFSLIDTSISEFYAMFYPELREDVLKNQMEWTKSHRMELHLEMLSIRFYNRISKIKARNRLPEDKINDLLMEHTFLFTDLKSVASSAGVISEDIYRERILPFSYKIKLLLEDTLPEEDKIKNETSAVINNHVIHSEYSYADIATFIGVSPRRLSMCKKAPEGYDNMKIGSFLKLCYSLKLDFEEVVENKHS
jgi:hypothetical protein